MNEIARFIALSTTVLFIFVIGSSLILQYTSSFSKAEPDYQVTEAFPNLSFNRPVGIYHAGDSTSRLFVVSQLGEIYVFENSEATLNTNLFLDLKDRVLFGGEQGLLGLAFHPDFSNNGVFYVDYTADSPRRTVVSRFSVSQENPNQADKTSEQIILQVLQPYSNHNGGQIAFGPDGYLYVALGDGGSGGDPLGNGQNPSTLLGTILRINVDAQTESLEYDIPGDNPFVGNTEGFREEIFAYGFRNPWRFSFDFVTGWLWVADVGQSRVEEIDVVEKGKNYGWNIMEGSECYSSEDCDSTGLELPVWEYGHGLGISVTGGFVYRGSTLPSLVGSYIYGDYGSGAIWALNYDGTQEPVNSLLVDTNLNIVSFGVDQENELYICAFDNKIYKLTSNQEFPEIKNVVQAPLEPTFEQSVNINVDVTSANGVQNVILSYQAGTEWENVTMSLQSDNTYNAMIPALPDQTQVNYRIIAYDNLGNVAIDDNSGSFYGYLVIPEFSSVIMFVSLFVIGTLIVSFKKFAKNTKLL